MAVFQKGNRLQVSRKGKPNKLTLSHREAVLKAAETGQTDGLVGYYRDLKRDYPEKFADAMKALLPREGTLDVGPTLAALIEASWKGERAEDQARQLEGAAS